jgi:hypothetical protein
MAMNRHFLIGAALVAALAIPVAARAHGGHAHKVMGTIESISGNHVTIKTTDGKAVMVMLDAKSKITQGKTKVQAGALKVGDRVVAEGTQQKDMILAATVKLGETPASAAKK